MSIRDNPFNVTEIPQFRAEEDGAQSALVARTRRDELHVRSLPEAPRNGLAPSLAKRRLQVFLAMMVADVVILLGSFASVAFGYLILYRGQITIDTAMLSAYLLLPIFLTISLYNGTYSGTALVDWKRAVWRGHAGIADLGLVAQFFRFFAQMNAEVSRAAFALSVVGSLLRMTLLRVPMCGKGSDLG